MKVKEILKITGSAALCAVLVTSTLSGVVLADEDTHRTEKTETVYSVLNPDGSVSDIVVSSWLHDEDGIHNVKEQLDLSDVRNVKTDEVMEGTDGVYTWNSEGNDIYYQGKADEQLPVSLEITYTLDGEVMQESDLVGKSGHLAISIHMTNTHGETKEINGKDVIIHPLFVAGGMLTMDNEHVTNVTCEQGKLVNDGSRNMLVFAAVPGLQETLNSAGLSKVSDQLEVGDDVVVECDVNDYESLSLMMAMSNEMDIEDVLDSGGSLDELTDGIHALMEADEQLLDGSKQLEEGTQQLIDESLPLTSSSNNIRTLSKGAISLNDGALQLQKALGSYTGGVAELNEGVDALYAIPEGAKKLSEAITTSADAQHPSLLAGIEELENGITQFKDTIDTTMTSTDISMMMESLESADALLSLMNTTIDNDLAVLTNLQSSLNNSISGLGALKSTLETSAGEISQAMTLSITALTAAKQSLPEGEAKTTVAGSIETLTKQAETLNNAFAALQTVSDGSGMMEELSSAIAALQGLQTDITNAENGLGTLQEIVQSSHGSVETLLGMQGEIDGVLDELIEGTKSLTDGANALHTGIATLEQQSSAGIDAIKQATSTLTENNALLNEGMASLQDGTKTLAEESSSFTAMADGLDTLAKAFETLHEGAKQLSEGQQKFKDDGLSALQEKADLGVDAVHMLETIVEEVKAMNEMYREYAGNNADMDVVTRYVFRTGETA